MRPLLSSLVAAALLLVLSLGSAATSSLASLVVETATREVKGREEERAEGESTKKAMVFLEIADRASFN